MDENNKFDVVGTNIAEKATMIWNVADMLRGPFKPHEYGLVILPMTVVKRFHDCLLPTHKAVPFELTTKEDRMRTCYMQACLAYVNFEGISNSDIRKIFGLGEKEKAKASRLLTSAVDGGYIKVMDPDTAPRYKKYIPY